MCTKHVHGILYCKFNSTRVCISINYKESYTDYHYDDNDQQVETHIVNYTVLLQDMFTGVISESSLHEVANYIINGEIVINDMKEKSYTYNPRKEEDLSDDEFYFLNGRKKNPTVERWKKIVLTESSEELKDDDKLPF